MEKSPQDCLVEWIILVGSPVYQYVRAYMLKISLTNDRFSMKQSVKSTVFSLATILFIFGITAIFHPEKFTAKFVITFIIPYFIVFLLVRVILTKVDEKRTKKLGDEYDD